MSFHLPLHRYFAVFLYQAVRNQGLSISELLPPPHELKQIIFHPLRVQVAFYEIISGLWVRNGLQIKGQAMTYIQVGIFIFLHWNSHSRNVSKCFVFPCSATFAILW